MVHLMKADIESFKKMVLGKKIICFGMGKFFERFIKLNPEIEITGIIDNYNYEDIPYLEKRGRKIPIWAPRHLRQHVCEEFVIVITSIAIEEMIEQLDLMEDLDGIPCFIEASLDKYRGIEKDQAIIIEKRVDFWVSRTSESVFEENYGIKNKMQSQKKYQLWEYYSSSYTGGSKAREDIKNVAGYLGYQVLKVHCTKGQAGTATGRCSDQLVKEDWIRCFNSMEEGAFLLIQSPAPVEPRLPVDILYKMKHEKHIHFICLIHDVEMLRKFGDVQARNYELQIMKEISDIFIVHNNVMKQYFISLGIDRTKIVSLQIFDYLSQKTDTPKVFERSVTIAANLNIIKSGYLIQLKELAPVKFNLYGSGLSEEVLEGASNITYHGTFPSDILPMKLTAGFGLVWDGDSIETCDGNTGRYLQYNNPHKLSLYLSAGLPVIIWQEAAEAKFVVENKVGFTVASLNELKDKLENIEEKEYFDWASSAENIGKALRNGEYTKDAIGKAERMIECRQFMKM